jgi:hypothetical protein
VEAASTSETSVNLYQTTRHNNPVASHLTTCDGRNLLQALRLHCMACCCVYTDRLMTPTVCVFVAAVSV